MAIQAQMYQENLVLPLISGGSQDWLFMYNNNNQNNFNNNLSNTNNNNNDNNNNNNNNMSFNGCGYNEYMFHNNIPQQKQQQQQEVLLQLQQEYYYLLQNQQQRNNNNNNYDDDLVFLSSSKNNCASTTTASTTTTTTTRSDYHMPLNFSPFFGELEKQRQEIDRFITLQNERLKMALQEQRKQQLSTIMSKLEAKAMQILTQKDEEIARATKRTIELEDIITKLEIETQEWKTSAIENEAMVVSLNNTLEQIKEPICCSTTSSSSTCCNNNVGVFNNKEKGGVLCKVCKSEKCCILMLPCRHLCCCKGCEPFVDACPVCKAAKMASIEALIS